MIEVETIKESVTDSLSALDRIRDEFSPKLPRVKYSKDDLLNICESHPHPAIRRIAGEMLYTMGERDGI
jgi:hypothetical protein